MTIVENFSEIL